MRSDPIRLSVALATYNGERYLREQLNSYVCQTRQPDELVACDDQSEDQTPGILEEFRARAPFPVRIVRNERRLGIMKNFERAVSLCTGEVIFLSDQDDVWRPEKLARHEAVHLSDPGVGLVFSDAELVDAELRPLGLRLWQHAGINPRRLRWFNSGRAFDLAIKSTYNHGCTMSFRSEFRDVLIPFTMEMLHDTWIASLLAALTRVRALPELLVQYRQHASQAVGTDAPDKPPPPSRIESLDTEIRAITSCLERLERFESRLIRRDFRRVIRGKLDHLRRRRALGRTALTRLPVIAREVLSGNYLRFCKSVRVELISDLRGLESYETWLIREHVKRIEPRPDDHATRGKVAERLAGIALRRRPPRHSMPSEYRR